MREQTPEFRTRRVRRNRNGEIQGDLEMFVEETPTRMSLIHGHGQEYEYG